MQTLINMLQFTSEQIVNGLKKSDAFAHYGERGRAREELLAKCIREFLPNKYCITSGEAVDTTDTHSKQIDLLIIDSVYANSI